VVYLNKREAEEIVRTLSNTKNKKIKEIIRKIRTPKQRVVYERSKPRIKQLLYKAFKERKKVNDSSALL